MRAIYCKIKRFITSPIGTLLLMGLCLYPLAMLFSGHFMYVVTGGLFASGFDRAHIGGALDQPSLTKWYFWYTVFTAISIPYVTFMRWLSNRSTQWGYRAFSITAIANVIFLYSALTVPFYWNIQYIQAMGSTLRRIYGIGYGICGYIVITSFLCWAVWPPKGIAPIWLDLLPVGFRLKRILRRQGYGWATLSDARLLLLHLRGKAYLVPPAHEYETVPGSMQNASCLIAFMKEMIRHKKNVRLKKSD